MSSKKYRILKCLCFFSGQVITNTLHHTSVFFSDFDSSTQHSCIYPSPIFLLACLNQMLRVLKKILLGIFNFSLALTPRSFFSFFYSVLALLQSSALQLSPQHPLVQTAVLTSLPQTLLKQVVILSGYANGLSQQIA